MFRYGGGFFESFLIYFYKDSPATIELYLYMQLHRVKIIAKFDV